VACVYWLMMWPSCMSRDVPLVGHTNISIDDLLYIRTYSIFCWNDIHKS
jgi:hypothetical protein